MPELPPFVTRDYWGHSPTRRDLCGGFSLEIQLKLESLAEGQVILDGRTEAGEGLALVTTARGTLELVMNDGRCESRWDCDQGVLQPGKQHHVTITADGGPKIITFIVDGHLCDGAGARMYGWGRFSYILRHVNWAESLRIAPEVKGDVFRLRVYDRALRTSEAVGKYRTK